MVGGTSAEESGHRGRRISRSWRGEPSLCTLDRRGFEFVNASPLQFLLLIFAGWVSRNQQEAIDYLQEENQILREQLGGKRLRFTDAQRRRLARKAKKISRKSLMEMGTIVTPDTLIRWYRTLVA